jgi:threonine/homoserine/homoserine lactone efflux protein
VPVEATLLSAAFAAIYLAWFGLYIAAVDRLGRWLRRPRVKARIERVVRG